MLTKRRGNEDALIVYLFMKGSKLTKLEVHAGKYPEHKSAVTDGHLLFICFRVLHCLLSTADVA